MAFTSPAEPDCNCSGLELRRFSTAGNDDLTARSGGRRLKSAKARNRGDG